jgi:serine/threonine protein phosphatase PrpC
MKLKAAALTDVGILSENNEDWFLMAKDIDLYLVADGVGGLEAGELASHLACRLVEQAVRDGMRGIEPPMYPQLLVKSIKDANKTIYQFGRRKVRSSIGSTLTCLWFGEDRVIFAAVGDSRIYLFRDGRLRQLSKDQTTGDHRLTASLGLPASPEVQLGMVRLREADRFLLCSDGVHDPLDDPEISAMLDSFPEPSECCERLVKKANAEGGPDNITVLVADVVEPGERQRWRSKGVGLDATSVFAPLLSKPVLLAAGAVLVLAAAVISILVWT